MILHNILDEMCMLVDLVLQCFVAGMFAKTVVWLSLESGTYKGGNPFLILLLKSILGRCTLQGGCNVKTKQAPRYPFRKNIGRLSYMLLVHTLMCGVDGNGTSLEADSTYIAYLILHTWRWLLFC